MLFPAPETAMLSLMRHAEQAWLHRGAVRRALADGGRRCHRCRTSLPGWLEIDHLSGDHSDWRAGNLAPICHFCHLALHPAQPGLGDDPPVAPIHWPGMDQRRVSALCWALVWLRAAHFDLDRSANDDLAQAVQSVLGQAHSEIEARFAPARDLLPSPIRPDGMLNALARLGAEPSGWRDLLWWPEAATPPPPGRSSGGGGGILRWTPGRGIDSIAAIDAGRRMHGEGGAGMERIFRLRDRLDEAIAGGTR